MERAGGVRCRWLVNTTPRPLYPRERDPVSIVYEAGWAPGPVWTGIQMSPPPWFDPRIAQPVVSRYTDWAIAAHVSAECQLHLSTPWSPFSPNHLEFNDLITSAVEYKSRLWHFYFSNLLLSDVLGLEKCDGHPWCSMFDGDGVRSVSSPSAAGCNRA